MKKYHVYGIGNALVDQEFEVEDSFLAHESIQKGIMTLVDGESQRILLERLHERYGLKKRAGGGSAANTLYAVSQFGGRTFYSCRVADDEPGHFYLAELGQHNIDTNLDPRQLSPGGSGQCLVMVSPDAERTMLSYLGISETLARSDVDDAALADSAWLYLEGYLVTSPTGRDACVQAKALAEAKGVRTALTLSDTSMVQFFRGGLEEMIGDGVDLLFANETEAQSWTGKGDIGAAARDLRGIARQFVITLGSKGALLFDGQDYIDIAPHKVTAVDSNGAGDMFAGAFLYALSAGHDFETAGRLASKAAASTVSHFGPRLSPEQHRSILNEIIGQATGLLS